MSEALDQTTSRVRWCVIWLLLALVAGNAIGRILAVNAVDRVRLEQSRLKTEPRKFEDSYKRRSADLAKRFQGDELAEKLKRLRAEVDEKLAKRMTELRMQRPFLSGNDRSRWLTVRALVEEGTYAIDQYVTDSRERAIWDTIDMVKHDRIGEPHLYSSKPTLLPTLLAGEYWLVNKITGLTLADDYFTVVRFMLITINVPAMLVIVWVAALLAERFGTTDWGRLLVAASAAFGTLLTAFVVVLNNHLIAAASAAVALYAAMRIWYDGERRWRYFVLAGFFAAFTAANELPALAFFALLGAALLLKAPRQTLLAGVPAAAIVVAGALGTNYLAHQTLTPPYWHRVEGKDWQTGNWYNYTYNVGTREVPSYWKRDEESLEKRAIIDRGEASRSAYTFHVFFGHHGIFSLTPIWLLSFVGLLMAISSRREPRFTALACMILMLSIICLAFYLSQKVENRNYGGTSSGLRWMFWFAPLWLAAMIPAADWTSSTRWRRILAGVLLVLSVASASYPTWNPWTHPWLAQFMVHMGWLEL